MCCNRLKRKYQCKPKPRSSRLQGAEIVYPFYQPVLFLIKDSFINKCLFETRPKRQEKLGLLGLFFCLLISQNIRKELLCVL